MASLAQRTLKSGKTAYLVVWNNNTESIWLGAVPKRTAEAVKIRVDHLLAAKISATALTPDTAQWLNAVGDDLHKRIARAGLCSPRQTEEPPPDITPRLGPSVDAYIALRPNLKPSTLSNMNQARKALVEHFGEDRDIRTITQGDGEDMQSGLFAKGLASNTVRRLMGRSKQFFAYFVRKEIIAKNPFKSDAIRCAVTENRDRDFFVTREMTEAIIDKCPDNQWALIVAMARYLGLRTPSESLALRWQDVLWDQNKIVVQVPKLAHVPGKDTRVIPLFPEVLPHLRAVFEEAKPGEEFVITRYRKPKTNLRTQFDKIVKRAGLKPFPKPLQNMRASRATELAQILPAHVCAAFLGHSVLIAQKHYLQVRDCDFQTALGLAPKPRQVEPEVTQEQCKA